MNAPASLLIKRNAWDGLTGLQLYWRSVLDTTGNGIGDLEGIRRSLGHFVWLGIDVLWITPMMASPQKDFGYDVSNYLDLDPLFGKTEDFEAFLAEAKSLGIKVILDLACNHTSEDHPWFQDAVRDPDSPYREWYVFRQGKPNGDPPNKWKSIFGGSMWSPVPDEPGMFYLHTFGSFQPELDWHNPEVRQAMLDIVIFWLDKGVSGFRLDAVTPIGKRQDFCDTQNPLWVPDDESMNERDQCTSIHAECQPEMYAYLAWFVSEVARTHPEAMMIPEAYVPDMGHDFHAFDRFYAELPVANSAPFNFALMFIDRLSKVIAECLDTFYGSLPEGALATWAISNHDQSRPATKMGKAQAMVAMALLLTLPGLPWLYMGQELNMVDGFVPDDWPVTDPDGRNPYRTPIRWTNGPDAGFTTGESWLPVGLDTPSISDQYEDPHSPFNLVRRLISLRHHNAALRLGQYVPMDSGNEGVLMFGRACGPEKVTVLLNLTAEGQPVDLPWGVESVLFTSIIRDPLNGQPFELAPGEILILRGGAA